MFYNTLKSRRREGGEVPPRPLITAAPDDNITFMYSLCIEMHSSDSQFIQTDTHFEASF